ncbi:MAG: hypothetical protein JNM76_14070 [Betaproteobacteria bacterium]|nr:hypothetical protein [Betaproteobacteria bacterium]
MARRKKWKPANLIKRAFFFIVGSLLIGLLIVVFEKLLALHLPKHFSVSIGVGLGVAVGVAVMKAVKQPPLFMKSVSPWVAGFCAGMGVHLARFWLR